MERIIAFWDIHGHYKAAKRAVKLATLLVKEIS